jgi:anti-sigma regulatory factor (Ser/Thr protein kinase)
LAPLTATQPFAHEALVYRDQADYLDGTMRFIYAALAAEEPVMVAAPPANVTLLRERLGVFGADVRFADMTGVGRNPGRIIPFALSTFVDEHAGRPVRVIGEPIWAGRSAEEYPACVQHEAMINVAFQQQAATILCPYDAATLPRRMLSDAYRTHPIMIEAGRRTPSRHYDPYGVQADYNRPLTDPPPGATVMRFEQHDLPQVRRVVARQARAAELDEARTDDLITAVNELASNSIQHGGGAGTLQTWRRPDRVVCEVRDFGRITDPMAGRRRSAADRSPGRGLPLVHLLCDLVQTYTCATGTTMRVHVLR